MSRKKKPAPFARSFRMRLGLTVAVFAVAGSALLARAVDLQVRERDFLMKQGEARHLRVIQVTAHRGQITDRRGDPLAVSTPVDSIWVNPGELIESAAEIPRLARALGRDPEAVTRRVAANAGREFLYLRRHMAPEKAEAVLGLGIPGVYSLREYRRFYPAAEVAGHVVGFTNIDDEGQEGLELAYDHWLKGRNGAKRVLRDRLGRAIRDVELIREARPGHDLATSIDLRIQYLAYRELKRAVRKHRAKSATMVVLDVTTGEILAMVNQPSYNPNDRSQLTGNRYRNRAATDIFEPGSAFKPLIVAAALESGRYQSSSVLDTSPGYLVVGAKTIEDANNLGAIPITTVLTRSSNVGASMIALSLEPAQLWGALSGMGVGQLTGAGFPGESAGVLTHYDHWRAIGQATLAYGYGVSMTALQLAQAYSLFGSGGEVFPATLLAAEAPRPTGRVLDPATAGAVLAMMETVVSEEGTAPAAAISGYRVAGKTGTARKSTAGGYSDDRYIAVFAGLAPASDPRLAAVVMVDEPSAGAYYGGAVAAPVFSDVVGGALRILGIPPDDTSGARPVGTLAKASERP